ncbi:MAG: TfoX/Sxy family protein [Parasporobacterium sp.]|nr:TfoX/Sxy family protein [Parasporobacterium sp.]
MASNKEYLAFILDQLSGLEDVSYRAMMGEYIIYCGGKVIGGIYDDRLLIKPTKSALAMVPDAVMELPYDGAKEMLLVENVDDSEFLQKLVFSVAGDLATPKNR